MENILEKDLENIGLFKYTWTIITGKNREVSHISKNRERILGEFIITIGNRAVIITNQINGRRTPIIVRRWKKIDESDFMLHSKKYKDSKGLKWIISKYNNGNEFVIVNDENGKEVYHISLK